MIAFIRHHLKDAIVDIDDPLFYAVESFSVLIMIVLLTFVAWSIGSTVWLGFQTEFHPWPGLFTSALWALTGWAVLIASAWGFLQFGKAVKWLVKG